MNVLVSKLQAGRERAHALLALLACYVLVAFSWVCLRCTRMAPRALRPQPGISTVEFAVIAAGVITMAVGAIAITSPAVRGVFQRLAQRMAGLG